MTTHMNIGLCYRIVFSDDTSMQFRYLGTDPSGQPLVETPLDSGHREPLVRTDVKDFYEIDVPAEELERSTI